MTGNTPKRPLGAARPSSTAEPSFVPLWAGKGRTAHHFVILDAVIFGYDTHFLDGRVMPCLVEQGRCLPCEQGWTPRWRGYVTAQRSQSGGRYIVQVTPAAWKDCDELRAADCKLRGTWWSIWRASEAKQARWIWKAVGAQAPANLPAGDLVEHVLSKVWGIDMKRLRQLPPPDGDVRPMLQPYPRLTRGKRR